MHGAAVPEMDAVSAAQAVALLPGGLLVIRERRRTEPGPAPLTRSNVR